MDVYFNVDTNEHSALLYPLLLPVVALLLLAS